MSAVHLVFVYVFQLQVVAQACDTYLLLLLGLIPLGGTSTAEYYASYCSLLVLFIIVRVFRFRWCV